MDPALLEGIVAVRQSGWLRAGFGARLLSTRWFRGMPPSGTADIDGCEVTTRDVLCLRVQAPSGDVAAIGMQGVALLTANVLKRLG